MAVLVLQASVASKLFCQRTCKMENAGEKNSHSSGYIVFGKGSTSFLIQALALRGREGQSHFFLLLNKVPRSSSYAEREQTVLTSD